MDDTYYNDNMHSIAVIIRHLCLQGINTIDENIQFRLITSSVTHFTCLGLAEYNRLSYFFPLIQFGNLDLFQLIHGATPKNTLTIIPDNLGSSKSILSVSLQTLLDRDRFYCIELKSYQ